MAVFEKFGNETDSNLPAELIGKVIFIIGQNPEEIWAATPIFDRGKIVDFHENHFKWPVLTILMTKLA